MNEVHHWLKSLGLQDHAAAFAAQAIEFDLLVDLDDEDLKTLGVTSLGHRKRLLRGIAELKREGSLSAGVAAHMPLPTRVGREVGRRQLTVMFCDLVGSTALSRQLDPEDLQRILRGYHSVVAGVVARYGGHIAQYLGDGVLVYFGYPQAHEDDAARAVRSALGVIEALKDAAREAGIERQTRIGIATGQVVVGEIGTGTPGAELSASGETPNLAARLQAHAMPGQIVVSGITRRLVGEAFALEVLGSLELKGFAAPVDAWRVLGERSLETRFEAQHSHRLAEFIGRDSEVALLLERWQMARDGEGQVVVLSGEAGIGKSRICQILRERIAHEPVATILLQCSPDFGSSELYPVTQYLARAAGMAAADSLVQRANKLGRLTGARPGTALDSLLRLMGLPEAGRLPTDGVSAPNEKTQTIEALVDLIRKLSEERPVLMLLEDAHWSDPTTEELVAQIAQRLRDARLLLIVTCRPDYVPSWGQVGQATRHSLNRLSHRQCAALVEAVSDGKSLPAEVLGEIIRRTDGIPLFIEELTKTVLQSDLLEPTPTGYRLIGTLGDLAIPATLQDSLMARLDKLAEAKEVAQAGAVIGREFSHSLLAEVLDTMPAAELGEALDALVRSELVFRLGAGPDATYTFKHALVLDTAYRSMLRSERAHRHRQIAAAIERGSPVDVASKPELLAYHYQQAGDAAAALRYWMVAGNRALGRSAAREALAHFRAANGLLDTMRNLAIPTEVELELSGKLGHATIIAEGLNSPLALQCHMRTRELAAALNRPDDYMHATSAIAGCIVMTGRLNESIELLDRFSPEELSRARPMARISIRTRLGYQRMLRGDLAMAEDHLIAARREIDAVSADDRQPTAAGADPMVALLMYQAQVNLHRGRLEVAETYALEGLAIAEASQQANGRAWARAILASILWLKADWAGVTALCNEALTIARRYGARTQEAQVGIRFGAVLIATDNLDEGARALREAYLNWTKFGGTGFTTSYAALASQVLLDAGRRGEAEEYLADGERTQQATGENYQASALRLLRGRLAALDGETEAAETAYREAVDVADQQGTALQGLRAATALAQSLAARGRTEDAKVVLRPAHDRFAEGPDVVDLANARALLALLG